MLVDMPTYDELSNMVNLSIGHSYGPGKPYSFWYAILYQLTHDFRWTYILNNTLQISSSALLLFFIGERLLISLPARVLFLLLYTHNSLHYLADRKVHYFAFNLFLIGFLFFLTLKNNERRKNWGLPLLVFFTLLAAYTRPEFALFLIYPCWDLFKKRFRVIILIFFFVILFLLKMNPHKIEGALFLAVKNLIEMQGGSYEILMTSSLTTKIIYAFGHLFYYFKLLFMKLGVLFFGPYYLSGLYLLLVLTILLILLLKRRVRLELKITSTDFKWVLIPLFGLVLLYSIVSAHETYLIPFIGLLLLFGTSLLSRTLSLINLSTLHLLLPLSILLITPIPSGGHYAPEKLTGNKIHQFYLIISNELTLKKCFALFPYFKMYQQKNPASCQDDLTHGYTDVGFFEMKEKSYDAVENLLGGHVKLYDEWATADQRQAFSYLEERVVSGEYYKYSWRYKGTTYLKKEFISDELHQRLLKLTDP